jgi:flagellar hook-associated protein 3
MRLGRVTQSMMSTQLLRNLNNNLSNMNKYQDQIATGRQINKPSDDPVGLSYAMRYRSDITANEQFEENIDSSLSWLEFTDTLMEQGNNVLQRIREISVQAANGSNPDTAMEAVRAEIMQLSDQLVTIGNSQFNGKYVFNGQLTDQAPYSKMITQQKLSIAVAGTVNVSTADVTANNNELKLKLDLGKELTVSIPPKDYSGAGGAAAFASDLQTAINEAASAEYAGAVTVAVTPDGSLNIRSTNNSSTGGVEITGGSLAREWLSTSKLVGSCTHSQSSCKCKLVSRRGSIFRNRR